MTENPLPIPISTDDRSSIKDEEHVSTPASVSDEMAPIDVTVSLPPGVRVQITVEVLSSSSEPGGVIYGAPNHHGDINHRVVVHQLVQQPGGRSLATAQPAMLGDNLALRLRPLAVLLRQAWAYIKEFSHRQVYESGKFWFGLALSVYLLTRLIGLTQFPIYFFTDEAIQTMSAADLVRDSMQGPGGELLPTYFKNGVYYNLSLSVYLQVLPYLLFGKSVWVTRFTSVLVTLLAAVAVGLILRDFFRLRIWWSGTLLLTLAPAWFLHSRTAFETVIFVSLYAVLLYFYLQYRERSPRYIYHTIVAAGLAFYTYSPGQVVIAVTGLFLLISDFKYHWKNRVWLLKGLGVVVLLAIPYLRFRHGHPSAPLDHLRNLGSYWVGPLSLKEKIFQFAQEYLFGLSPGYWYLPNQHDLPRHIMKGYGHLSLLTLPFAILGLVEVLRNIRKSPYRLLLAALLAAPAGSALVGIGITRTLVFIIPATLLTALGLALSINWLEKELQIWWKKRTPTPNSTLAMAAVERPLPSLLSQAGLQVLLAILLIAWSFAMLRDALKNGPLWYSDYGLGGMQYGAKQMFQMAQEYLVEHPDTQMIVSPSWANGTDVVARFFLGDPLPVQMGSIEGYFYQHLPMNERMMFVMIPSEYEKVLTSSKFTDINVERTMKYPNGQEGFYFVRLRYADNIDEIMRQESEVRRQLQQAQIIENGMPATVFYSMLDMGNISDMFDGNRDSVLRTFEANPMVVEVDWETPRTVSGITAIVGSAEVKITVQLKQEKDSQPVQFEQQLKGTFEQPEVGFDFGQAVQARYARIEILDLHQTEPAHVHLWELYFR